ncbi:hypothetical protein Smp_156260 [Schistosoma mansoni]|uniref:hypothetical protein n=1 Tax=Schistosoma mansoni TaxID=6183 RepID=UPI0001A63F66|nr:hypothetical protein Smp_156260 [Schistosoma mansoni]|eukprot:XP_018651212.1 hypothetical protein Smp_156260 [Schistosoma mansoni]
MIQYKEAREIYKAIHRYHEEEACHKACESNIQPIGTKSHNSSSIKTIEDVTANQQ